MRRKTSIVNQPFINTSFSLTRTDYHIARLFTGNASIGTGWSETDVRMIERMLDRAYLPLEVMAIAFNIICALECRSLPKRSFDFAPNDLIVVAALSLAVLYNEDRVPTPKWWSRNVCDRAWTPRRIDKTVLQIFAALEWRLYQYATPYAVQSALRALRCMPPIRSLPLRHCEEVYADDICEELRGRELFRPGDKRDSACWVNGQITPNGTPPGAEYGDESRFLPLL